MPAKPPFPIEYRDCDDLVALIVRSRPGIDPHRDPLLHSWHGLVEQRGAADEQDEPGGRVPGPRGRHVEQREEDPVVEERAPQVVRLDDDEHRRAPDREQRPEVLQASLGEHLPLLAEVAGEEDDQHDLGQLAGLELDSADVHPQAGAVDPLADQRESGQEEEPDRRQPEEVLVALEAPVVVA